MDDGNKDMNPDCNRLKATILGMCDLSRVPWGEMGNVFNGDVRHVLYEGRENLIGLLNELNGHITADTSSGDPEIKEMLMAVQQTCLHFSEGPITNLLKVAGKPAFTIEVATPDLSALQEIVESSRKKALVFFHHIQVFAHLLLLILSQQKKISSLHLR